MVPKLAVGTLRKGSDGRTHYHALCSALANGPCGKRTWVDICMRILLCCVTETNTILNQLYPDKSFLLKEIISQPHWWQQIKNSFKKKGKYEKKYNVSPSSWMYSRKSTIILVKFLNKKDRTTWKYKAPKNKHNKKYLRLIPWERGYWEKLKKPQLLSFSVQYKSSHR